jgi:hypothetical protein
VLRPAPRVVDRTGAPHVVCEFALKLGDKVRIVLIAGIGSPQLIQRVR